MASARSHGWIRRALDALGPTDAARPWTAATRGRARPRRILAIRLQATGDVVITLPYLQSLRRALPADVGLDFLTRVETDKIPRGVILFDRVFSISGARSFKRQVLSACLHLPALRARRYDLIIDLQNNELSELVRRVLNPPAWSTFDPPAPGAAGEKTRAAIEAAGLGAAPAFNHFRLKDPARGLEILDKHGRKVAHDLVVLNPAAAFETRSWPIENYVTFAALWRERFPRTQFLVLGTSFIAVKADYLQQRLGDALINLVGLTDTLDAFSLLQRAALVLSEDSGLMHMAWVSGVPTLAMFGSTRSDWARPLGPHTFFLDSSDLPCGNCMQATCRLGDVRCMTRFTPALVCSHAFALVEKTRRSDERASAAAEVR